MHESSPEPPPVGPPLPPPVAPPRQDEVAAAPSEPTQQPPAEPALEAAPASPARGRFARDVLLCATCLTLGVVAGRWTDEPGDATPAPAAVASAPLTTASLAPDTSPAPAVVIEEEPLEFLAAEQDKRRSLLEETFGANAKQPSADSCADGSCPLQQSSTSRGGQVAISGMSGSSRGSLVDAPLDLAAPVSLKAPPATAHTPCELCQEMKSLGTALKWAESPAEASKLASDENKLVFLIHVSGNFEIPEFT